MKKILFAVALLFSFTVFANTPGIDEAIVKEFKSNYPNASSVKWYENKEGYQVFFIYNKVQCRINYDLQGHMQEMRRDYNVENLPLFIKNATLKTYPNKSIYGVTEITTPEGLTFHMVLEDAKSWTMIESTSGGQITQVRKLRKA
jgi:hypothetical protein